MLPLTAMMVAILGQSEPGAAAPEYELPVAGTASFSPDPELWGLRELSATTALEDLDQSFVLYVPERTRLEDGGAGGWVYFTHGRQLVVENTLTERDVAARLESDTCLCGLEYDIVGAEGELQLAAGAYRLAAAPAVNRRDSGITSAEFQFEDQGQTGRLRLRRLVCWSSFGQTLRPMTRTLAGFARLTRKEHPSFADPPMDDRPIGSYRTVLGERAMVLAEEYVGRAYDPDTLLREIARGGGSPYFRCYVSIDPHCVP